MRPWIVSLAALFIAVGTASLSAPAQADTTAVMAFSSSPSPAFGSVAVGSSRERTFTLTNTSPSATAAITVSLAPTGAFTIPAGGDKCTGTALSRKKTCTITVRYTPVGAGANDTATLTASAKKPGARPAVLGLAGSSPALGRSNGCTLVDVANVNVGYTDLPFNAGEVVTLTVNSGSAELSITQTSVGPSIIAGVATPGNPVHYTFPLTGTYVAVAATNRSADLSFFWSCALP